MPQILRDVTDPGWTYDGLVMGEAPGEDPIGDQDWRDNAKAFADAIAPRTGSGHVISRRLVFVEPHLAPDPGKVSERVRTRFVPPAPRLGPIGQRVPFGKRGKH